MTQKKSKIPVNVLKKFDKVLYKPGNQVVIKWLGEIKQGYVKETKKLMMAFITWLKPDRRIAIDYTDTPAEYRLENTPPSIQQDSYYTTKPTKNIPENIKTFLQTPEGQKLQSEMTIQAAEEMMIAITEKMQTPDLTTAQRMMLSTALQETTETLKRHEKILQSMTQ
jgi:hypothetical protein